MDAFDGMIYIPCVQGAGTFISMSDWESILEGVCSICEEDVSPDDFSLSILEATSDEVVCGSCVRELDIINYEGLVC